MKTLIVALNSKYIHTALAPWYLKASCGEECGEIIVMEFSINDNIDAVLANIYKEKADVVSFSCYIWNISLIMKLAESLKKILPDVKIALGGPEVSFDAFRIIEENAFVDFVVVGEGEKAFRLLLLRLMDGNADTSGLEGTISKNDLNSASKVKYQIIENLDTIPTPYTEEMLSSIGNRMVYYESSRGCPFSCSYCLSSSFDGVRYFSMDRLKWDLTRIINVGVVQIKFVDRTFNCNRQRAKDIFRFIIDKGHEGIETNFHFEVAADLFDDEMFEILGTAPEGLIQFEIGVQTTNLKTLEAVNRKTDLDRLFKNVVKLKEIGKTHVHMDLIAGLPEEDLDSFRKSFNEVYNFRPHQLQLGFLKMLKGSNIRVEAENYGYGYRDYPPYEVLFNKFISFDELLILKDIEEMVERYYNWGRFRITLQYLIPKLFDSAFDFYRNLSQFYRIKGYMEKPPSGRTLYTIMNEFFTSLAEEAILEVANELLKLDFLATDNSNNLPDGLRREIRQGFKEECFDFLKKEENIEYYLPGYKGIPAKQIFKNVHFETFKYNFLDEDVYSDFEKVNTVVLFDYNSRNKVTGQYDYKRIKFTQN